MSGISICPRHLTDCLEFDQSYFCVDSEHEPENSVRHGKSVLCSDLLTGIDLSHPKRLISGHIVDAGAAGNVNLPASVYQTQVFTEDYEAGVILDYIEGNRQYLKTYLRENIPQIVDVENEGLYLVWLDCRELGLDAEGLERFMLDKAGLWVNQGYTFGSGGEGFVRMNLGCPRSILEKGLARLHKAVNDLRRAM
jgi:hypothetical protein